MIATVPSSTLLGVDGYPVVIEVHVSVGLPAFNIVGLPDTACREARDRVRAALLSSGLPWPSKRVTVNLAPSGLRKVGTSLDLGIAVAVLVATEVVSSVVVQDVAFVGELGLDGSVRTCNGVVPLVDALHSPTVVVAAGAIAQAVLVNRHKVRGVRTLGELVGALNGAEPWPDIDVPSPHLPRLSEPDMADVRGQRVARQALEVAAAGGHNLLLTGPPGAGKTMLARRLPGLLPDLDETTALTCTRVHSAAGVLASDGGLVTRPPWRAPHHTASVVSIIGGGAAAMRPGEISLAHGGVLFLDELAEFGRGVLESLRQPLEEGEVRVSRAAGNVRYPSRIQLIAASNPCPCGEGRRSRKCACLDSTIERYRAKLSGPLLDRFDMRIDVGRPLAGEFLTDVGAEGTDAIRSRVEQARARAVRRGVRCNAELRPSWLQQNVSMTSSAVKMLHDQLDRGALTGRGLDRVRRVALTVADLLDDRGPIDSRHVATAVELHASPFGTSS